jgi:hypothetical protein
MSVADAKRIDSMDQFRGFLVAGMVLVNFVSRFDAVHPTFRHNDTYFSWADSVMPSFLFVVGFAFRLTYLRRRQRLSMRQTVRTYVRRSLVLVGLALVIAAFDGTFELSQELGAMPTQFQPFREKAPRTRSFEFLLMKAKEADSGRDALATIDAAYRIGEAIAKDEPPRDKARYQVALQAEQIALAEGTEYVGPAIEREKAWQASGLWRKICVRAHIALGKLLKSDLWNTLGIIGVTQLLILPWIGCRFAVRFLVLAVLGVAHLLLSYWFNWDFVYGLNDNWLSKIFMTGDDRSWDGGLFGPLSWGMVMLAGTLAYDLFTLSTTRARAVMRLIAWGAAFMAVGYTMSCLSRLYDRSDDELAEMETRHVRISAEKAWLERLIERQNKRLAERGNTAKQTEATKRNLNTTDAQGRPNVQDIKGNIAVLRDQERRLPNFELAESPVLPPWRRLASRSLRELLVEPPFVAPATEDPATRPHPRITRRPQNYWMMGKRMPNLSFMIFAAGFAFAAYALFVIACDIAGLRVGLFRTFGTNALVAYFLHEILRRLSRPLIPDDGPLWECLAGFEIYFLITYFFVLNLERRKIYVKL